MTPSALVSPSKEPKIAWRRSSLVISALGSTGNVITRSGVRSATCVGRGEVDELVAAPAQDSPYRIQRKPLICS